MGDDVAADGHDPEVIPPSYGLTRNGRGHRPGFAGHMPDFLSGTPVLALSTNDGYEQPLYQDEIGGRAETTHCRLMSFGSLAVMLGIELNLKGKLSSI